MSVNFQQDSLCEKYKCFNHFCTAQAEKAEIVEKAGSLISDIVLSKKLKEIESYDTNTYEHSIEVGLLSLLIGQRLDLSEQELKELGIAAFLHDYGKIKVPIEIINKPGPLDIVEREIVEVHTALGAYHLRGQGFSSGVLDGIYEHHESFIGSERGYSRHLVGSEIHLFGRIIAVADKVSAYGQNRAYHEERSKKQVVDFISKCVDTDKEIVSILIKNETR